MCMMLKTRDLSLFHFNGSRFILLFLVSDYNLKPFPEPQAGGLKFFILILSIIYFKAVFLYAEK